MKFSHRGNGKKKNVTHSLIGGPRIQRHFLVSIDGKEMVLPNHKIDEKKHVIVREIDPVRWLVHKEVRKR